MKSKARLYLSGPMTGIPDYNYPEFFRQAKRLEDNGFEVVNPAIRPVRADWGWADYLRADIPELLTCEGLATMEGWSKSRGARLEWSIADALGMTIRDVEQWLTL